MLCRAARNPVKPVSISNELLIFAQSDMDANNFAVDEDGNTVLLDFGEIGVLPSSLVMFVLSSQASFTAAVAKSLGWPGSANRAPMAAISSILWRTSLPSLGASTYSSRGTRINVRCRFRRGRLS